MIAGIETRKFNQQNHKLNMFKTAAHYPLKKEHAAVVVALKDQLVHLKIAN
jgi:hypothetical protein